MDEREKGEELGLDYLDSVGFLKDLEHDRIWCSS
jgi:hypothetical protein